MTAEVVATVPRGTKPKANGAAKAPEPTMRTVVPIPLDVIDIGPNVRVNVEGIDELAASIAEHGVLQPIKVRFAGKRWIVVWGQRRVLAARKAGLKSIPALTSIEEPPADKLAVEQLVENLHRADLNPIDRAQAMRAVVDAGVSQADLARKLGIGASTIANDLGLLEAPEKVRDLVDSGELTPSHAKALKGLAASTQAELAKRAVQQGLSAHATEQLVQDHKRQEEWRQERQREQEKANREAAERLTDQLGNLAKKKVPLDAKIVVTSWDGTGNSALVERIQKLGYTNVSQARRHTIDSKPAGVGCDCAVWRVEGDYGRLVVAPSCVNEKHQRAKSAADEMKRRDKYALETSVHEQLARMGPTLANVMPGFDNLVAVDHFTARMLLWHALDYNLADWAEKRGGKRGNPWGTIVTLSAAELAAELGKAIAKAFRDRYGYHVPWADLAVELGIAEAPAT